MKKKRNWPRLIWITSLFLLLIVILLMVMDYKINYQYLVNNTLYFYECDGTLCVSEVENNDHLMYSKYECGEECPIYKNNIDDNHVLLTQNNQTILYQYRTGKVISKDYDDYEFISQNYIIVTKGEKKGILNIENHLLVPTEYDQIGYYKEEYLTGYNLNYIIAQKDGKYGIISYKTGEIIEEFLYEERNITELLEKLKSTANS